MEHLDLSGFFYISTTDTYIYLPTTIILAVACALFVWVVLTISETIAAIKLEEGKCAKRVRNAKRMVIVGAAGCCIALVSMVISQTPSSQDVRHAAATIEALPFPVLKQMTVKIKPADLSSLIARSDVYEQRRALTALLIANQPGLNSDSGRLLAGYGLVPLLVNAGLAFDQQMYVHEQELDFFTFDVEAMRESVAKLNKRVLWHEFAESLEWNRPFLRRTSPVKKNNTRTVP